MIKKLLQGVLLFSALYMLGVSVAVADNTLSCTHTPSAPLTLQVGQSQDVTYTCNTTFNYSLTFNSNGYSLPAYISNSTTADGLIINAVTPSYGNPTYVVKVTAQKVGTYSAPLTYISFGEAPYPVVDNGAPLSVTVTPSSAPSVTAGSLTCNPDSVNVNGSSQCSITYTNSGTADATSVSVTPSVPANSGSISNATGCGPTIGTGNNNQCTETFTYTAPATVPNPNPVNIITTYADAQNEVVPNGTTNVTVTPAPAPSISAGTLNCATPITAGSTSACSVTYTNSGNADATGATVTPSMLTGPGSISGASGCDNATLTKNGGQCTENFTYDAPAKVSSSTIAGVQTTYSDTQNDQVPNATANITVNPPAASNVSIQTPLACNPNSVTVSGTSQCSITYINNGNAPADGVSITAPAIPAADGVVGSVTGCDSPIADNGGTCTAQFQYTAPAAVPATNPVTVTAAYQDTSGDTVPNSTTPVTITPAAAPSISVGALNCASPITAGNTSACSVTYTNNGNADATDANVTPSITSNGPGSISDASGCDDATLTKNGGQCTENFTYNAPAKVSSQTIVGLQTAYADQQKDQVQNATANVTVNPPAVPSVSITTALACNPATVTAGQDVTSACSVTYTNAGTADATNANVVPTITSGPGSIDQSSISGCQNVTLGTTADNNSCTQNFTYDAPTTVAAQATADLQTAYTDTQGDSVPNGTTNITVNPPSVPSVSITTQLACTPSSVNENGQSQCSITYTNAGIASATGVTITPNAAAGTFGAVTGCGSSIAGNNGQCTAQFTYTAPSDVPNPNPVQITAGYTDNEKESLTSAPAPVTINAPSVPNVTGSLSCNPTSVTVSPNANDTSACTVTYTNNGNAEATQVSVTPSAANGSVGTVTGTCITSPTISANGGTCQAAFTYTAPTAVPSSGSDTVSTAYTDAQNENVPDQTSIAVNPVTPSSGITGAVQSGQQCTLKNYPTTGIITCVVQYTNNGPAITFPADTTITPAGSVSSNGSVSVSGSCPTVQLSPNQGSCSLTYQYTPSFTDPLPQNMAPVMTMSISANGTQLASVQQAVQFQSAVEITNPWTCSPTHIVNGGTTTCSIGLQSTAGVVSPDPSATLTGVISPNWGTLALSSGTFPQTIHVSNATQFNFTYTAPSDVTNQGPVSVGLNYSDNYGESTQTPINPVTITVGAPVTASGIRCYPSPAQAGQPLTCSMYLTNLGSTTQNVSSTAVTIAGQSVTPTFDPTACPNGILPAASSSVLPVPCLMSFTGTAPSANSATINVTPPTTGIFDAKPRTISVYGGAANIQSNPIQCSANQLAASGQTTCSVLFRNMGSTQVTGVTVTPEVDGVPVSGVNTTPTCSTTNGVMNAGETCVENFTYTAPATLPTNNSAKIMFAYQDAQSSYPAFQNPYAILLLDNQKPQVTGSVLANQPCSSGGNSCLPANSVAYASGGSLQMTFYFMNTGATVGLVSNGYHVVAISDGKIKTLHGTVDSDPTLTSCTTSSTLNGNSACTLTINFAPYNFNGFKIGEHIVLAAWLDTASGLTGIASQGVTIGAAPIFSDLISDHYFIQSASEYKGAFIFGNNHVTTTLNNLRAIRLFVPAGFAIDTDGSNCPAELATKYPGLPSCASLAGSSLAAQTTCYACFYATSTSAIPTTSPAVFEAQLPYDESMSTVKTSIPVVPQYRTITLQNSCAGPVWPAFVSGAAYYHCNTNADCPVGTTCDTASNQCNGMQTGVSNFCTATSFGACPNRSTCSPGANNGLGLCFWTLPDTSAIANSELAAGSAPVTIQIPNTPLTAAGDWSTVWGGGVIGRTGCDNATGNCDTGSCINSSGPGANNTCSFGVGGQAPVTQAEFTLLYQNQDYYDVEIINGFSIPVSMTPISSTTTVAVKPSIASPYSCNAAGTAGTSPTQAVCPWNFTMQSYNILSTTTPTTPIAYTTTFQALHTLVTNGNTSCTQAGIATPSLCAASGSSGPVCGISQANISMYNTATKSYNPPAFTCGNLIGFWSSNEICANNAGAAATSTQPAVPGMNYSDPTSGSSFTLNCGTSYGTTVSAPLSDWFGCSGAAATSCYGAGGKGCCGCPYWTGGGNLPKEGQPGYPVGVVRPQSQLTYFQQLFTTAGGASGNLVLSPNGSNDYCKGYSDAWTNYVMGPSLIWMKQGCGSTYTFAFDDATSTFTCSSSMHTNGTVVPDQVTNPAGTVNTQNYQITFCPANNQGTVNGNSVTTPSTYSPPTTTQQSAPVCPPQHCQAKTPIAAAQKHEMNFANSKAALGNYFLG